MEIRPEGTDLVITLQPHERTRLRQVRSLPSRRWDRNTGTWRVPLNIESYDALVRMGIDPGVPRPKQSGYSATAHRGNLSIRVPPSPENIERCKRIPDYRAYDAMETRSWLCKPTPRNVAHLRMAFPDMEWDAAALELIGPELQPSRKDKRAAPVEINDYKFHTPPFRHQREAFALCREAKAFALLMEQGTGKTKVLIDDAAYQFIRGRITGVLVVAPNSVKSSWTDDEIPLHLPPYVKRHVALWSSTASQKPGSDLHEALRQDPTRLTWVVMNVEALATAKGFDYAARFLNTHAAMMVLDESTRFKSPSAKRTRAAHRLGKLAAYRRILTGTPVTKGPLDAYAQFKFLDERILGFGSYYAFRNHYAIMGGYGSKEVVAYTNLDELQRLIDAHSYRALKADCLDLPAKVYQRLTVDLSAEQARLYKQMKDEMLAELDGQEITTTTVLTQMLRLQQIVGGFLPRPPAEDEDPVVANLAPQTIPIPGPNPKLLALLELVEDTDGKMIVWCRFRAEIDLVARALREAYGEDTVVEFHGDIGEHDRTVARQTFQDPSSPVRFLVGQTETGGIGLTLTQARTVVYFSNSFSLESRLQSEDRAHRIGQTETVTYVDIVARGTLDIRLLSALRNKKNLADMVTGDAWREWI